MPQKSSAEVRPHPRAIDLARRERRDRSPWTDPANASPWIGRRHPVVGATAPFIHRVAPIKCCPDRDVGPLAPSAMQCYVGRIRGIY
ncbi:hypothetical protein HJFPF1_04545 [Paramyrothecium foliicola]|nr:hypothetical protein HJFPF1_04545 [Paramyrothecium foliicola]